MSASRVERAARAAAVALFTAIVGVRSAQAQAQAQVTVPPGAHLMGTTIPVQWNASLPSLASSSTVSISLAGYGGGGILLAANVPNNGHATVTLPVQPVIPCEAGRLYWIQVGPPGGTNAAAWSAKFTLSCGATITVVKTVVNNSGGPLFNVTFAVGVACGPNGPNTTLALNGANGFQNSVRNIAIGRTCLITEQPPRAAVGCRWKVTYPQDRGVDIGAEVEYRREVHNELHCVGLGPLTASTGVGRGAMVANPRIGPGNPTSRFGATENATVNWKGTSTRTITLPASYSVRGVSGGHTVYQSADGQFFYLDPQTGDVKMLAVDFALTPTGGTFIRHDGGPVTIVGVDPAGNVLQRNARGEVFYLHPQSGAVMFVKWPK